MLRACIDYIHLLPKPFYHRIKFIDNPNPVSKQSILIDFDTDRLTNDIKVSGEGMVINVSIDNNNFPHNLSVHPITNYKMYLNEYSSDRIPDVWETLINEKGTFRCVPPEYFAVYNLAYDLTSSVGVFGRAINSHEYQMRDGTPIGIFSIQTEALTPFTYCCCAMPRWYRIKHYNLFALAWNDLVRHVRDIRDELSRKEKNRIPKEHVLSDWIVLSLLRIHICIEMNYSPFLVTKDEKDQILERIIKHPLKEWGRVTGDQKLLGPIKRFVKQGLITVMAHIQSESLVRVLSKHQRAFRTWVEYGLPMLSDSKYVSGYLGKWIVVQWIKLLKSNGTLESVFSSFERVREKLDSLEPSQNLDLDLKQHSSHFFLQENAKQPEKYKWFTETIHKAIQRTKRQKFGE